MMTDYTMTEQSRVRRLPKRGAYDKATIHAIVDATLICHVGFVQDEQPFVMPTLHARRGDEILLHGSSASRMLQHALTGASLCITMTLIDGLVLARSAFHHSVNYRSAVLFGCARPIPESEKIEALKHFTERLVPERWDDVRAPTAQELKGTTIVAVPIDTASAKVRTGPPIDDDEDYALSVWAGVLPLQQQFLTPQADPKLRAGVDLPAYLTNFLQQQHMKGD
ncbi:MAG: pyridoxamine 5'-phosphate oxidase family protein [Caldilineaceae bacterium]